MSLKRHNILSRPSKEGFTLVEILVVVAISAVLMALGAPSFSDALKRYRINGIRDSIISSIQMSRTEAIRRGLPVIIERKTGCGVVLGSTQEWGCGWNVYVDVDQNNSFGANDVEIQIVNVEKNYNVMHLSGVPGKLIVNKWGQPGTVGESFVLSPPLPEGVSSPATTTVCINAGGRVRYMKGEAVC
jgi:type IV fimbrial biogenesis protein FimT